jgi:CheY-like chemotaxis protein
MMPLLNDDPRRRLGTSYSAPIDGASLVQGAIVLDTGEAPPLDRSSNDPRRILVVEDHPNTQRLIQIILEGCGYRVDIEATSQDGSRRALSASYDAVLIDINLGTPESGFEVLESLRMAADYADVPMLAVTAYALPGDRARCLDRGFDGYVSKPFSRQTLLDAVHDCLEGSS